MEDHPKITSAAMTRAQRGLFFSQLDNEQTNADRVKRENVRSAVHSAADARFDRLFRLYEHYVPPASATETHFRHRGWMDDRNTVRQALALASVPASRIERFDKCGSDAWIQADESGDVFRIKACYCGDRFCRPCADARARKARAVMCRLFKGRRLRFITLTLRGNDETLAANLHRLYRSFERLRQQKFWREAVEGGIYFIEITRGADGGHWHVHCHALVCGRFVDKRQLSAGWKEASGGSFIVDVRQVADNDNAAGYVSKYATKGFDRRILADTDHTVECILALRGRRLFSCLGCWHGVDLTEAKTPAVKWRTVAKLDDVVRCALKRQTWALGLLRAVRSDIAIISQQLPPIDDTG